MNSSDRAAAAPSHERLPWGETFPELTEAVLADKSAPPALLLAAFQAKLGDDRKLRSLIADALALDEADAA